MRQTAHAREEQQGPNWEAFFKLLAKGCIRRIQAEQAKGKEVVGSPGSEGAGGKVVHSVK